MLSGTDRARRLVHRARSDREKTMAAKKKGGRKYGKTASKKVEKAMHERKHGTLRSGGSGKKVKSKKQAIAIGLSEARQRGAKVPKKKGASKKAAKKKTSSKKTSSKKSVKKSTRKSSKKSTKKTARKKRAS
jgi:hypothetical protein